MVDRWIAQYGKRLYGLCLHLCRNTVEADDLYQDTWIRVLRNQARFDPDMPFEPWLTKICVNLYRSRLRRIARSPFLTFADGEQQDAVLESVFAPEEADYSDLYAAIDHAGKAAYDGDPVLLSGDGCHPNRSGAWNTGWNGKVPTE